MELVDHIQRGRPVPIIVAEAIRRQITLGRLRPGDSLPTERELSEQLGIGRTTLRKAIKMLVDEGRLATKLGRGGGTVVLENAAGSSNEVLLEFDQCKSAIEYTYEARLALEPAAAELAASRATEDQIRYLCEILEDPAPTVNMYHSLDSQFHTTVAEASENLLLLDAVENSRVSFFHWANVLWLNTDWQEVRSKWGDTNWAFKTDHSPIVDSIADGDREGAHARMTHHLENSRELFRQLLEQIFPGGSQRHQ
ncbi:FCD domain-containing protein [soil metagenome]